MIRINLLTEGKGAKRPGVAGPRPAVPAAEGGPPFVLYGAILVLVLMATGAYAGWLFVKNRNLATTIAQQREELKKYQGAREKVAELEKRKTEYTSKLDQIKQLKDQQSVPVKLMNLLVEVLPDGAWYTAVSQGPKGISLEGAAKSIKTISSLYDNLVAVPDFSDVQLGDVTQMGSLDEVYTYKLNFVYSPGGVKPAEAAAPKPAPKATSRPRKPAADEGSAE